MSVALRFASDDVQCREQPFAAKQCQNLSRVTQGGVFFPPFFTIAAAVVSAALDPHRPGRRIMEVATYCAGSGIICRHFVGHTKVRQVALEGQ